MTDNMISNENEKKTLDISFVTLTDRKLALPSAAIMDVIHLAMPQAVTKMPRWFLGFLPWKRLRIPFISFESASGSSFKINANSNIAILRTATPNLSCKFFAILIQKTPVSATITEKSLIDVVSELAPYEQETVRLRGNDIIAKIPNIVALEELMIKTGVLS